MRYQDLSRAYIAGRWIEAEQFFPVADPASGEILAHVTDLSPSHIESAVTAAVEAFGRWAARTAHDRAVILKRRGGLILANQETLGRLMTADKASPWPRAQTGSMFKQASTMSSWLASSTGSHG